MPRAQSRHSQQIAATLLLCTLAEYAVDGFVASSISKGLRRGLQARTGCWRHPSRFSLAGGARKAVPSVEVEYGGVKSRCGD